MSELPFTGERFTPECLREMWYEHYHRYAFVRDLVAGRRVADVACGEGYGAMLLAQKAAIVRGLDINAEAIAHARSRYGQQSNLSFELGDACTLPWPDASFDVLTSFETLEHLESQEELLAGFARVLHDEGVLVISSPDKLTYSDQRGYQNEFHVRELYREEFLALLGRHFGFVRIYGQKLLFQSAIWREELRPSSAASASMRTASSGATQISDGMGYAPMYFIAVCAKKESALPNLPDVDWFGDADESVYRHYEHEIRKNMQAGAVLQKAAVDLDNERSAHEQTRRSLQEAETRIQHLEHRLARPWWRRWNTQSE